MLRPSLSDAKWALCIAFGLMGSGLIALVFVLGFLALR